MKAVILAGGKGTRLGEKTRDMPKPMLPLLGKPLLEYHIEWLKKYGITQIWLTVGYQKEKIQDYFGNGEKWGVNLLYFEENEPLGTSGAIKLLENELKSAFLVIYGDVLMQVDLFRLSQFHKRRQADATLVLHPNDHPHDSDLVTLTLEGKITRFHPKPRPEGGYWPNMVNAGLYLFEPTVFPYIPDGKADFGRDVFKDWPEVLRVAGYNTSEYLKDMGTPDRLEKVEADLLSGKVARRCLTELQKAIFLDRDGVLNVDSDLIKTPEELQIYPYTADAIHRINQSEYLAVLATNQSVVARNLTTIDGLAEIHAKLETELGKHHAWLDAIQYCPHHPDGGYPGENPVFKTDCDCRKPKPGMLLTAAEHFHIDLSQSWMIGDSERDVAAGKAAGCKTIGLETGNGQKDTVLLPDFQFANLEEAVHFILTNPYKGFAQKIAANRKKSGKSPYIIALGGNTRSGKSTLAQSLEMEWKTMGLKVLTIHLDDWILPADQRTLDFHVMESFQSVRIETDLPKILDGIPVETEGYAHHPLRKPIPQTYQYAGEDIVLVEGVIALKLEILQKIADLKMLATSSPESLKARVEHYYQWKGKNAEEIEAIWEHRWKNEYQFILHEENPVDYRIENYRWEA